MTGRAHPAGLDGTAGPEAEPAPIRNLDEWPYTYRPDSLVDAWSAPGLQVRAASIRGDSHRHYGVPRQDDLNVAWNDRAGMAVIAVADGVSAAALSHIGAATVCRYAVQYLLRLDAEDVLPDLRDVIEGCAWALIEAAQRMEGGTEPDPVQAERLLATTLCLTTVTPVETGAVVRAMVVGDSGVGVIRDGLVVPLLGGKAQPIDGITDMSVVPLPRLPDTLATGVWTLEPGETLIVATDGIWDPVGDGSGAVGRFLATELDHALPSAADFLRIADFYRETHDDDRTLVAVRISDDASGPGSSGLSGRQGKGADGQDDEAAEEENVG